MFNQRSSHSPRRFWRFLALGVPWVLGVGLLVAAQHVQGGAWLVRGLIDLATGPSARHDAPGPRHHDMAPQWEGQALARSFRFEPGQHVATVGTVPPSAPVARLDALNLSEPQVWTSIDHATVALGVLDLGDLAELDIPREEVERAVAQARRAAEAARDDARELHLTVAMEAEAKAHRQVCELVQSRAGSKVGSFRITPELAPRPRFRGPITGMDG